MNANFEIETEHLNKTIEKFSDVAYTQELKGIDKYGNPLNPFESGRDWLNMAIEEQVDGMKYLYAEMVKRRFAVNRIRELIPRDSQDYVEIMMLLDELEGSE